MNKKTGVKNATQVNFQTIQDSPNATSASQGNTVKQDKHRAFLVFLAKRVLLLDKNAIYAPRAISPIQRHKKCAVNVLKDPATKALATLVASAHPRAHSSTRPMEPRTAPKVSIAKVGRLDENHVKRESTHPTLVPSNVSPVHPVHLPHPTKPLNAKSARKGGFKKKKAKTTAVNRTMAPFPRVVLLRWKFRKVGTVPIAATASAKNQNRARKAPRAAMIANVAFLAKRAKQVSKDPRHAFPVPKESLLR